MLAAADAVHSERFTGNLEARHVFAAVAMHHHRLERTRAHRIDALERIVGAEQRVARRTCRVVQMIESRRPYSAAVRCGGRHIVRIAHTEQRAAGCLAASARVTARSGIVGRGAMDTSAAQGWLWT